LEDEEVYVGDSDMTQSRNCDLPTVARLAKIFKYSRYVNTLHYEVGKDTSFSYYKKDTGALFHYSEVSSSIIAIGQAAIHLIAVFDTV
jgi:hypothetical protein